MRACVVARSVGALALVLAGAACGGTARTSSAGSAGEQADAGSNLVEVKLFKYSPRTLTISAQGTVRWVNYDDILHTVTTGRAKQGGVPGVTPDQPARPDGRVDGRLDGRGSSFEFTFREPGRYPYFCSVHTGMEGEILVE